MKSTNEEYQSVNEEMQSSNEELETAKEEMQSVNEELQTINTEMAAKNEQLTELNSDLSNLLESTEIATLFLDENLRVRRFTRGVNDVFHLREADVGRPITEIVSLLEYTGLRDDVKTVLRKLVPIEREVMLHDTNKTFILRVRPYRTVDNVIDGAVLTFVDISEQKRHDEQQELLLREMDHRVKNLFAIAGGVVSLSARSSATPQDMAATIQGRLGALANAHQLVRPPRSANKSGKAEAMLAEIVRTILRPYIDSGDSGEEGRAIVEGPDVAVGGDAVTSMAMVLHELATNAAKYGAFATPGGRVEVSWSIGKRRLELSWVERGGPAVEGPPEKEGFGSLLARRSVSGQLDGEMTYDWQPEGLTVHLSAAAERLGS